jgi:hypothetical protein
MALWTIITPEDFLNSDTVYFFLASYFYEMCIFARNEVSIIQLVSGEQLMAPSMSLCL